ncbi:hypothetical protein D0Y96_006705 [Acidipila sp. 4G-K13]|uniref:Lipoprotein n=2 Tax=Paracidobacterium acidisoli TaxID=2303751 RepID=A0A372ISV9_9BACT|nr:hypothetical protein [Paracidobacterium acidisoli]
MLLPAAVGICLLSGCRSRYVQTTITNHTDTPLRLIEVDYPSASFGTDQIAPQQAFHYRFKVQGSGPVTITFTGDSGKPTNATGPQLSEGEQGTLQVSVEAGDHVKWATDLVTKP